MAGFTAAAVLQDPGRELDGDQQRGAVGRR